MKTPKWLISLVAASALAVAACGGVKKEIPKNVPSSVSALESPEKKESREKQILYLTQLQDSIDVELNTINNTIQTLPELLKEESFAYVKNLIKYQQKYLNDVKRTVAKLKDIMKLLGLPLVRVVALEKAIADLEIKLLDSCLAEED